MKISARSLRVVAMITAENNDEQQGKIKSG